MAGLHVPLLTLRDQPRGWPRIARGRCGSLVLHRTTLAFATPRRLTRRNLLPAPTPRVKGASPIAHVSGSACPSRARRVDASCDLRRRPARTRGGAPAVSAQRGTSG